MNGVGNEVTTITFVTKNMKMEGVCKKEQCECELWYAITATKSKDCSLLTSTKNICLTHSVKLYTLNVSLSTRVNHDVASEPLSCERYMWARVRKEQICAKGVEELILTVLYLLGHGARLEPK